MRHLILFLLLAGAACGQDIAGVEYYFDIDPGYGNGSPLAITPSDTPRVNTTVSTAGLDAGLHLIAVRFRDSRGFWGTADKRLFYVLEFAPSPPVLITAAEYFLGDDPGLGSGVALTLTPGLQPVVSAAINVSGLSPGLHQVGLRFRDERGLWGAADLRRFYLLQFSPPAPVNIAAAEYFFDDDPGAGNGSTLTATPGSDPVVSAMLDVSGLDQGLHAIGIRFRDERGFWGVPDARLFYLTQFNPPPATDIVSAEHYYDSDPGYGMGLPLSVIPGPSPVIAGLLDVGMLSAGLHRLHVRFRDAQGDWGVADARLFYIVHPTGNVEIQTLAGAEYFVNVDPGLGAGIAFDLPLDLTWDDTLETVADSIDGIPIGRHLVGVRFRDNRGRWGATAANTVVVAPLLTIMPSADNHDAILRWFGGPDATQFEVSRAATCDGVFSPIATVTDTFYVDAEIIATSPQQFYSILQNSPGLSNFRLPRARVQKPEHSRLTK